MRLGGWSPSVRAQTHHHVIELELRFGPIVLLTLSGTVRRVP